MTIEELREKLEGVYDLGSAQDCEAVIRMLLRDLDGEPVVQRDQMGFPILGDGGEPLKTTAGDLLSAVLARGSSQDPIHTIEVAMKIRSAKEYIQLDNEDITLLEGAVKTDRGTTDLAKAFLLTLLKDANVVEDKK